MNDIRGYTVCLCVNDDSASFLNWSLRQYRLPLNVVRCGRSGNISHSLAREGRNILIIEFAMINEPAVSYLQRIRGEQPSLRIILIVPPTIKKEEAMQMIREKLVEGMLVQPFSTDIAWNYVDKICSSNRSET